MGRTNIVIDDALVEQAMALYGTTTRRETVDLALRHLVGSHAQRDMLDLVGTGWQGDLEEMRGTSA